MVAASIISTEELSPAVPDSAATWLLIWGVIAEELQRFYSW